jgi:hypothetical protein
MDSLPEDAGGGPAAVLSRFRREFHACLTARADELSELADAGRRRRARPSSPAQHRIQRDLLHHNLTFCARGALRQQAKTVARSVSDARHPGRPILLGLPPVLGSGKQVMKAVPGARASTARNRR